MLPRRSARSSVIFSIELWSRRVRPGTMQIKQFNRSRTLVCALELPPKVIGLKRGFSNGIANGKQVEKVRALLVQVYLHVSNRTRSLSVACFSLELFSSYSHNNKLGFHSGPKRILSHTPQTRPYITMGLGALIYGLCVVFHHSIINDHCVPISHFRFHIFSAFPLLAGHCSALPFSFALHSLVFLHPLHLTLIIQKCSFYGAPSVSNFPIFI